MTHPDDSLPLHAQIANQEFRLAMLREKRENFRKQGRLLKRGAWVTLVLGIAITAYFAVTTETDPVPTVFLLTGLLGVFAALLWISRKSEWIGEPGPDHGMAYNRYTSYRAFTEAAIEEGEKLLAELKSRL